MNLSKSNLTCCSDIVGLGEAERGYPGARLRIGGKRGKKVDEQSEPRCNLGSGKGAGGSAVLSLSPNHR